MKCQICGDDYYGECNNKLLCKKHYDKEEIDSGEQKEQKPEPEIINLKDLAESSGLSKDKLEKIALVCLNCGHKDLLVNFVKKNKPYDVVAGFDEGSLITPRRKPMKIGDPFKFPPKRFYSGATGTAKPLKLTGGKVVLKTTGQVRKGMSYAGKKISNMVMFGDVWDGYEDYFKCPVCKSALVCLDEEFVKNNLLRGLEDDGEDNGN